MKIKGKEARIVKNYENWILIEYIDTGIKEGIHKHDLGLIKEGYRTKYKPILKDIFGSKI